MAREEDTGMGTALSGLAAHRKWERSKNETRSTRSRGDRRDNIGPGLRPCDCSFQLGGLFAFQRRLMYFPAKLTAPPSAFGLEGVCSLRA